MYKSCRFVVCRGAKRCGASASSRCQTLLFHCKNKPLQTAAPLWFSNQINYLSKQERVSPPLLLRNVPSRGDHTFVSLAVGHVAPVVVGPAGLVGLLLASVQECVQRLSLAFGTAHHVAGTLGLDAAEDRWDA